MFRPSFYMKNGKTCFFRFNRRLRLFIYDHNRPMRSQTNFRRKLQRNLSCRRDDDSGFYCNASHASNLIRSNLVNMLAFLTTSRPICRRSIPLHSPNTAKFVNDSFGNLPKSAHYVRKFRMPAACQDQNAARILLAGAAEFARLSAGAVSMFAGLTHHENYSPLGRGKGWGRRR